VRPARQHSRLREEGAGSPAGACLSGWSRKSRGMAWPAVGVVGVVRPPQQPNRPWKAGAGGTTGAALGG